MSSVWMCIAVLIPILFGIPITILPFKNRKIMLVYTEAVTIATSVIVLLLMLFGPTESFVLFSFTGNMTVEFRLDGLGALFTSLVAFLWPLATLYAFEYMTKERHENVFFAFYTITYGVTLGISMADDILTLYVFYEMLTLVTVPLIMHTLKREAILATRTYLYYSIGGAAFAFLGMVFIISFGQNPHFTYGGIISPDMLPGDLNVFLLIFVLTFMGFGVKAAIWPLSKWLPMAGVAPTPVTALLHAVAVVNSGAFGMMRLTYFCYDVNYIKDSWAQYVLMGFAIITIVYGCSMAVKERHLKRRLANSTVGNLSYMVFGVALMSPLGFAGALMHFVCHSFMKITSFFCAGAIIHKTEKNYVYELNGLAKKMPKTMAIFTISSLALMGVPGLCGFVSKYALARAAVDSNLWLGYLGLGALLISALLTAIYMMTIVVRVYLPKVFDGAPGTSGDANAGDDSQSGNKVEEFEGVTDPGPLMLIPLVIFTIIMFVIGFYSKPLWNYVIDVARGIK